MKAMLLVVAALFTACGVSSANAAEPAATSVAVPRVVIVGDSTASRYGPERYPRMGWGQVVDRFFDARVVVLDRAQSGRSSKSFIDEGWFDRVADELRAGDLLLIQFGHNDEKVEDPTRHTEPDRQFPAYLRRYLALAREKQATPVLITPVARRAFDGREPRDTHGPYAKAVRDLAASERVALIDLAETSRDWLRALGVEASKAQYLHVPDQGLTDDTHFHERGAVAIACLVVGGLKQHALLDATLVVRDTDCGAKPDALRSLAAQTRRSQVIAEATIARPQAAPHGGNGRTTAYPFFADAPDMPFFFRKRVLHAGASIGLHQHDHDEVYYVISGQGDYVIDGEVHAVGPGHAMLTRTGSTHTLRQVGADDLVVLITYLTPASKPR